MNVREQLDTVYTVSNILRYCITILIGIPGNLLVLYIMFRSNYAWTSTNIYLTNLALADLLVMIAVLKYAMEIEFTVGDDLSCKLVYIYDDVVFYVSLFTILCFIFEIRIIVCDPIRAAFMCTRKRATVRCLILWIIALVISFSLNYPFVSWSSLDGNDGGSLAFCTNLNPDLIIVTFVHTIVFFIMPLFLVCILYSKIHDNLLSHENILEHVHNNANVHRDRQQIVTMLKIIICTFFILEFPWRFFLTIECLKKWFPEFFKNVQTFFKKHVVLSRVYYNSVRLLLYTKSAINPIIFNAMSSGFRHKCIQILKGTRETETSLPTTEQK